jgi:two-component system, NtrC family, sensor kinase
MMTRGGLSWLVAAGLALALATVLMFLFARTQRHHASSYFENVALLRQLKQLDARWELDVLKSRMGINSNYDSLVDPLIELNQLQEKLRADIESRQEDDAPASGSLLESFHRAIEDKTRLIEHFKSHNSVLRNSLAFLPTAAEDFEKSLRHAGGDNSALRTLGADVNRVLLQTMVFSLAQSDDAAAGIRLELQRFEAVKRNLPASVLDDSGIFASHVETVLREQPVVNGLLQTISAVPAAARLDAIYNLLSGKQRADEMQIEAERKYLSVFAAALAALLLYAAVSLIRSHAVINRVNKELHRANATLEERVKERTRELREAQSELVATARKAGMAQIANNVLHNVGNVLNSVNVSAELIDTQVRESRAAGLAKVAQLLSEHAARLGDFFARDDRGKVLPSYLNKLAAALADERQGIALELESLKKSVHHIKEVVATQHAYSGATSVLEWVRVQDLVEDALRMNAASVARRDIAVVKDFAEVPLLMLDKHLLLQILVNLITNAERAMEGMAGPHQLTLRVGVVETSDEPRLRIRVEDDGEGIAPENLSRLFVHGFTTRKNGHGFGLHSCALAAKEMAGAISAHSEGPGKGAVFTLDLPVNAAVDGTSDRADRLSHDEPVLFVGQSTRP